MIVALDSISLIFLSIDRGYNGLATHISQPFTINGLFDYAGIKAPVIYRKVPRLNFLQELLRMVITGRHGRLPIK